MNNVKKPANFLNKLVEANDAIYQLFELCREKELPPQTDDGCVLYDEEAGKYCFQVSGQYSRPGEFLAALLDMIRVTYEPAFFGSFFLNSNPAFIYDGIPKTRFTLGYLSIVGAPAQSFTQLWHGQVAAKLEQLGYDLAKASSLYLVVAGSQKSMSFAIIDEVNSTVGSGLSTEEVLELFGGELDLPDHQPRKGCHAGYVFDEGLDERLRISLWTFIEGGRHLRCV